MRAHLFFGFLVVCLPSWTQSYVISTLAGAGAPATPAAAVRASVGDPGRIAGDASGNIYFGSLHSVFKVDSTGTLTRVAGNGRAGNSGDGGPALSAQFLTPMGIAFDAAGAMYVVDRDAAVVRRIAPDGSISTVAGASGILKAPLGIAVDTSGNIYVSDTGNNRVARFSPDGQFSSVGDGIFNGPEGLAMDAGNNLYIADTFNGRVRKASPDGTLAIVAGSGSTGIFGGDNNPAVNAALSLPTDVAVDAAGNLYIADFGNSRVRKVTSGIMSTVAGNNGGAPLVDGEEAVNARLNGPTGVAIDGRGNLFFVEGSIGSGTGLARGDFRVFRVGGADGILTTLAGTGAASFSGDGGAAVTALLNAAAGVTVDSAGNVYISDTGNNRLRMIAPNGNIATISGTGAPGFSGDNVPPSGAQVNTPRGLAANAFGRLYFADSGNSRVRAIDPGGNIFTFAGNGNASYFGDNLQARVASVNQPEGVAIDSAGNVYIADTLDNAVRKVGTDGSITTIAGFGTPGFSGDGGPAVRAALDHPRGVAVAPDGTIYIADTGNNRVRKVDFLGNISTVAADLSGPRGVAVDRAGVVYISDTGHNQVLRGNAVVAGTGACCFAGDGGFATAAMLNAPAGLAVDDAGNVYVADSGNSAVRVLRPVSGTVTVSAVTNAASNQTGAIAPGEVVAIYGSGFAGVQTVLFNGSPASPLYTTDSQIGAVVPAALAASSVQIVAQRSGAASSPLTVPLARSAPGVFTIDDSGHGQAVATNQDGSTNGANAPAPVGSAISIYVTGDGNPQFGAIAVTIGGVPATVKSTSVATLAAQVLQINAVVPAGLSGAVPVVVNIGGNVSQAGVTIVTR
jgi:uncharacterized protein (TIGR03437 family)